MRLIYICFLMLLPLIVSSQEETFYIQFDDQSVVDAFAKMKILTMCFFLIKIQI